jgi:putative transposase
MSKENLVLKLKLEGTDSSIAELNGQSRICNWLYNHLLQKCHELKSEFIHAGSPEASKTLYTKRGLRNALPKLKQEHPFLKVVHSSPLKNTALRLSDAIQAHQKSKKGKRKGKQVGWPKFRAWKRNWFSLFYDEPDKGFKIQDQTLILSLGIGEDRKHRSITLSLPEAFLLKNKIVRNLRIVSELGQYYAIFTIQKELPARKPISKIIALDPNHKNLAYGVDTSGTAIEIAAPKWLKNYDKRLDELKSKRDRCNKKSKKLPVTDAKGIPTGKEFYLPSKNWAKYDHALKKALHKRREQTKTFMFTSAHQLFKSYDCVGIGDYTPNGEGITAPMRRAMNNRSLNRRWKNTLAWVACKSGKTFIEFDEKGTTRTCHHCLHVVEQGIPVTLREWQCPQCQTEHIRDENAAINGLKKVLRDLPQKNEGEHPSIVSGSDLAFVKERWAWCVLPSGVFIHSRGQNGDVIRSTRKLNRGHDSPRSKPDHLVMYDYV